MPLPGHMSVLVPPLNFSGFIPFVDEGTSGREAGLCRHPPAPAVEKGSR